MKKYSWFVRYTAKPTARFIQFYKRHSDGFKMTKDIELIIIMLTIITMLCQLNSKVVTVTPIKDFIALNVMGWGLTAFIAIIEEAIFFSCRTYQTYMGNVHSYLKGQQKN